MESVSDNSTERKYFTQVCNLIDELDLSPLAIALYLHYKRWAFTDKKDHHGVKFLKEKFKVGADKIRAAKDELVKNKLMKFKTFDPKLAKSDEAIILDIWKRNYEYFQSDESVPIPIQEQVTDPFLDRYTPVPVQVQTHSYIGTDPFLDRNAIKEEDIKEKNTQKISARVPTFVERSTVVPVSSFEPVGYTAECFEFLDQQLLCTSFDHSDWETTINYIGEKSGETFEHFKGCVEYTKGWATSGRVTAKMVAGSYAKFLEQAGKKIKTEGGGCAECNNHPNCEFVSIKGGGWIYNEKTFQTVRCACNPKPEVVAA